jgi:glycerol kinase
VPVRAAVGDQQASLFGLRCWEPGAAKVTLGTGAFVLAHAGEAAPGDPAGVLGSTPGGAKGTTSYALEGFIPTAGRGGRLVRPPRRPPAAARARRAPARGERRPGRVRAGACRASAPRAGTRARAGALLGLSLGTTRADLARAVVDGVLHQVTDAGRGDRGRGAVGRRRPLRSDWIVQRLADLAGVGVRRTARADSTALGAATLAASPPASGRAPRRCPEIPLDLCAEPQLAAAERDAARARWAEARELSASRPGTSP